jgi:virginiamycin B lyase
MRRSLAIVGAITCAALLVWAAFAGADSPGSPTSYAVPSGATGATGPTGLAGGSDGGPWFVETDRDANAVYHIGTVTSGKVLEYPTTPSPPPTAGPSSSPEPTAITDGIAGTQSAGYLWFTVRVGDFGGLEKITTSGAVTAVTDRLPYDPSGIAADANGNLWVVTGVGGDGIDEIKPPYTTGTPTTPLLAENANPQSIVEGPDGHTMWFTEPGSGGDALGSVDQTDKVTQYPVPVAGALGNIVVGSDGNLWTGSVSTSPNQSAVLRITPQGVVTPVYLLPGSNANPDVIAAGPDGRLWMADNANSDGGLTAVTTAGTFTNYPGILPTADRVNSIVEDPGGADALWLIDQTTDTVDRVLLSPPPPPPVATNPAPTAPPALTAALQPVSALTLTGATLAGTISEPAGNPATAATYYFQYGTSTAYGSSTPSSTATATTTGTNVTAPLSGLTPYTTYHYRLVASDCAAASCETVSPDQTFTTGSTLQPMANTTVGATTTAGHVLIELRGKHHFVSLTAGELIPLGATIDARHGTVLIQSAIASSPGEVASGLFSGGEFIVTQPAGGTVTVLVLASSFKACVAKPLAHVAAAAAKKKAPKSKKVVNQVFGDAHGQFSTHGHYATAADQGTGWRVADRCDGTLVSVSAGQVRVTDFVRHRSFELTAGHHYLAHAH